SSSQRKQRFHDIQVTAGAVFNDIKTLTVDMKVRWSSTYMMLNRAYNMPLQHVEKFITEISRTAKDRATSAKLYSLLPSAEEWNHVKKFQRILQSADACQQRFSSEHEPALHLALPALEDLHACWTERLQNDQYEYFEAGLQSGLDKISEYYDKTGHNDVYVFSIILSPRIRFSFFERSWPKSLRDEAMLLIRRIRYADVCGAANPANEAMLLKTKSIRCMGSMLADLSSDEETHAMPSKGASQTVIDPGQEWEKEFNKYVMLDDDIPETVSTVHWWGLNAHCFPIWASLARDYLAIMATSVSSERAFSSAGITITKRRNRLKGDIVEALQALKCAYHKNLFFHDVGPSSFTE
ncbi:hATC-domain-containing protein, partial [Laetiporus sulphureus 93-53]